MEEKLEKQCGRLRIKKPFRLLTTAEKNIVVREISEKAEKMWLCEVEIVKVAVGFIWVSVS